MVRRFRAPALILFMLLPAACARGPLQVETIQLGRGVNPDGSVTGHTTTFSSSDTIYVAVLTSGPGEGTIGVRWTYAGRVVGEPERQVSYNGPAATSFQMVGSGGFPQGNYSVEVFVDGESVGSRNFRVD